MSTNYVGNQIVLSSGRLIFNSRSDSAFISSKKYINLSAGDKVTIDVGKEDSDNEENMFLVNAPKIQFGLDVKGQTIEPVVKGNKFEEVFNEVLDINLDYTKMMQAAVLAPPLAVVASLFMDMRYQAIRNELETPGNVKSNTVYTI
jgi:hypothetical protein